MRKSDERLVIIEHIIGGLEIVAGIVLMVCHISKGWAFILIGMGNIALGLLHTKAMKEEK